jgi:tRNA pseudouridine55 synthase
MSRRKTGRNINGLLLFNKPSGMTSNYALQKVRRCYDANKAGHTGSLDPLARGLLPLCFGEATKFSGFLLNANKRYEAEIILGVGTDSGDSDGKIISRNSDQNITKQNILDSLIKFKGEIEQVPPMYSALKHNGQPLYKLARQGIEIERKARKITIFDISLISFTDGDQPCFKIDVTCSKGTYIRSLAIDIGAQLGVDAHISGLYRTEVGGFSIDNAVSINDINPDDDKISTEATRDPSFYNKLDAYLLPIENMLYNVPAVELTRDQGMKILLGQSVKISDLFEIGTLVKVLMDDGIFIGVCYIEDIGLMSPKRLVQQDTLNLV